MCSIATELNNTKVKGDLIGSNGKFYPFNIFSIFKFLYFSMIENQMLFEQDDDAMFTDFLEFDIGAVLDYVEDMSNLESKISPMEICADGVDNNYELTDDFPIMTDLNEKGEFSDSCDLLWQQAGEYVQEIFEKKTPDILFHSCNSSGSSGSSLNIDNIQDTNAIKNIESMQPNKYSFQSPSLAEWVHNYVEIIYDDQKK